MIVEDVKEEERQGLPANSFMVSPSERRGKNRRLNQSLSHYTFFERIHSFVSKSRGWPETSTQRGVHLWLLPCSTLEAT